ncbi:T9SS-dependent choice-of-anchor J family protein [Rufibacter tibetensis]|uniref:T9SS-dependent choice-of-anchor J family protein n=1 Tax=Rufibacter tibetensis TaxID=512763 RepID=UPI000783803B|nr:choice-of-anchor J domain-containing protein [Rufibacter tibetensis]
MPQKLLFALFLLLSGISQAIGQTRSCGTMQHMAQLERERPNLRAQLQQQARMAGTSLKQPYEKLARGGVVTIPVVVHVVYNTVTHNISDEQVASQIAVLNKDFRRLNADSDKTPDLFKSLAADAEIEFCLAQRTPDGEPTNGITRTQTDKTNFDLNDAMKFTASGGKDAWNTSQYLNIWVIRFANTEEVLGYAQFPNSGSPLTDGVVIDYRYFGTSGTALRPFNLGRTTTHEVGHWLNLFHIWGDESCGNDQVEDTPVQEEENSGCPTFPSQSCTNTSDMFMNYMDYTNDACMNLFTTGQKTVMQNALGTFRSSLLTSLACNPVQVPDLDAALMEVTSPTKVLCATSFSPGVVLRNKGSQTLTSAHIQYRIDSGPLQTFNWTGSLGSFQSTTVSIPAIAIASGAHTITYTIASRNNAATDANAANNTVTATFQVQGVGLPLQEGFESATFPPAGWIINNPNQDLTWERTTKAAKTGVASAYMNNIAYTANGLVDELVLPPLDLTTRSMPKLSFQMAYALLSESGFSDTLEVLVSTDCGTSYRRIYQKFGQALTTATPYFTDKEFIPTEAQWRLETLDLAEFATAKTVSVKFRHVTDFENNLYLDDVKVDGDPLGAEEERAQKAVQVAPNPTSGTVYITSPEAIISSLQICDAVGRVIQEVTSLKHTRNQPLQITLLNQTNGIYFIKMMTDKGVVVRRVMLLR